MQLTTLAGLMLAAHAQAQLTTISVCASYSYTATLTFTEYTTYYNTADGIGLSRSTSQTSRRTSLTSFTLPPVSSSYTVTDGGIGGSRSQTTASTSQVPGNGTSVLIPGNTITPTTPIPTSSTTTTTISTSANTSESSSSTTTQTSSAASSLTSTSSTDEIASSTNAASTITSLLSTSSATTLTSTTSESTSSTVSSSESTTISQFTTNSQASTSSTSTTATTSSPEPTVTNQAYIDTVIRHHNRHRANHTAPNLVWDAALAATAKKIADGCVYAHDTAKNCPTAPDESCYGQNIGAGYLPIQMGSLISEGFYNGEVNSYTYYGGEPDYDTLHQWGHFSQIVWVGTGRVGCYTSNCTASGLQNIASSTGIRPFFTVCNYGPPGNYIDEFKDNVLSPLVFESIFAGYECPTSENCVDGSV